MTPVTEAPPRQPAPTQPADRKALAGAPRLPLWRLHLLRAGYVFVAGGILTTQWPMLLTTTRPGP